MKMTNQLVMYYVVRKRLFNGAEIALWIAQASREMNEKYWKRINAGNEFEIRQSVEDFRKVAAYSSWQEKGAKVIIKRAGQDKLVELFLRNRDTYIISKLSEGTKLLAYWPMRESEVPDSLKELRDL